jgi:hypothetical protein
LARSDREQQPGDSQPARDLQRNSEERADPRQPFPSGGASFDHVRPLVVKDSATAILASRASVKVRDNQALRGPQGPIATASTASPYAAANLGQITQDGRQVVLHRRKLCCEQLTGESVRRHAATASLASKAVIGNWGDVDYAIARGHYKEVRDRQAKDRHDALLRQAATNLGIPTITSSER